jgi:hypothetical protein
MTRILEAIAVWLVFQAVMYGMAAIIIRVEG